MVVLSLVSKKNGETVTFDEPIPKVHFAKLISCSLPNSWYNLKKDGWASFEDRNSLTGGKTVSKKIFPGHYDVESLSKEIEGLFVGTLKTLTFNPVGHIVILNSGQKDIEFNGGLKDILSFHGKLGGNNKAIAIKKLSSPSTYFIYCDLIDKEKNLFNGKKSDLLATFDLKGKPFEKVTYLSAPQEVYRQCSSGDQVNSITLSVKDLNGQLFDFNGIDMEFELELN